MDSSTGNECAILEECVGGALVYMHNSFVNSINDYCRIWLESPVLVHFIDSAAHRLQKYIETSIMSTMQRRYVLHSFVLRFISPFSSVFHWWVASLVQCSSVDMHQSILPTHPVWIYSIYEHTIGINNVWMHVHLSCGTNWMHLNRRILSS